MAPIHSLLSPTLLPSDLDSLSSSCFAGLGLDEPYLDESCLDESHLDKSHLDESHLDESHPSESLLDGLELSETYLDAY